MNGVATEREEPHTTAGAPLGPDDAEPPRSGQPGERSKNVLQQLRSDERLLGHAHTALSARAKLETSHSYASEWFLDNYYLIRGTVQQAVQDLPAHFYRRLPRDAGAGIEGPPRVHALARALVDRSEARLDLREVEARVREYQKSRPLTMGELWALPAMLRVATLERLADSMSRIVWRPHVEESVPSSTGAPTTLGAHTERSPQHPPGVRPASREPAVAATDDEQVANCVVSLRAIRHEDWEEFFERLSVVEQALRAERCGVYARMDFATRDSYRKVVERLAAAARHPELEVAQAAVALADEHQAKLERAVAAPGQHAGDRPAPTAATRRAHVGFYLVADGLGRLGTSLGYAPSVKERLKAAALRRPGVLYLGSILLLTALLLAVALRHLVSAGGAPWQQVLTLLVAAVPALSVAVGTTNLMVNRALPPRRLPKLDFSAGLPDECRTAVVVPALLTSTHGIDELLRQLEQHYLGNADDGLVFALLTDNTDADDERTARDDALVRHARLGVKELNRRHGRGGARFCLLHRKRLWNEREGAWMGWERKRGKLEELNRLLRGANDTSYVVQEGAVARMKGVSYVLTLDADTRLPPGAARRLLGTLAHPLNRAEFDERGRVIAGYSLLQPRIDVLPESSNATAYSRLFAGENGLDLYTLAVSDVYQDLFGAGIYVGKGLYHVDDFQRALRGKVPENRVLSHDLLEGVYAGVGLVTDVVLYEEYPPTYLAHVQRLQRWVRGDWQLLPWLLGWVFGGGPASARDMRAVDAWKLFDNLRRSLVTPAVVVLLVLGWTVLDGSPAVWSLFALATLLVPLFGGALSTLLSAAIEPLPSTAGRRSRLRLEPLTGAAMRFLVTVAFLPYEALMVVASACTALYRLVFSHQRLLEWRTAAQSSRALADLGPAATALRFVPALALTAVAALLTGLLRPPALWVAAPVLALWAFAPLAAHVLARGLRPGPRELEPDERLKLHALARRTWLYFEQFVSPDDNWLPPDNVQTGSGQVTAHRTSPTNIGLLLLSTLSAYDLGYIGLVDLSLRLKQSLDVIGRLEHYRGHLLNWYDTRTLRPLAPRYVSSVDSGNLLASLIALSQGCREILDGPVEPRRRWGGLIDTIDVLSEVVEGPSESRTELTEHLAGLRLRVEEAASSAEEWPGLLAYLEGDGVGDLRRLLVQTIEAGDLAPAELEAARIWSERVAYNVRVTQREFDFLLPWNQALAEATQWEEALPALAAEKLDALRATLMGRFTLREAGAHCRKARSTLAELTASLRATGSSAERRGGVAGSAATMHVTGWADELSKQLESCAAAADGLVASFESVAESAAAEVEAADMSFLYDDDRDLLRIGYNVDAEHLDDNYYDLLASEARLASLVGIATGKLPVRHWLHLGRPLARVGGRTALLSWSGTMFEYLMPNLLTRQYAGTLLEQSCAAAVQEQVEYASRRGVPWGISESGYGRMDGAGTFQYRAFGVPSLGLDRGQQDDLIIAPYASMLALATDPDAVLRNLHTLRRLGAVGAYGLYEALDFSPARRPLGRQFRLVSSYMAHHQGMILVSLANALQDGSVVERFHADPRIATAALLLQEKVPSQASLDVPAPLEQPRPDPVDLAEFDRPWRVAAESPTVQAHLLSNGHYSVLITAAGAGHSSYDDSAVTRPLSDGTLEDVGSFIYVHDLDDASLWSLTRQPLGAAAEEQAEFSPYKATFARTVNGVMSVLEVVVSEDDAELRRVTFINQGERPRRLKLTSYAEVVLGDPAEYRRHPAFSKLFVESSWEQEGALVFRRRPRSGAEAATYALHALVQYGGSSDALCEFETDRSAFLGRGGDVSRPYGPTGTLQGGVGATLDPVMALATSVTLPAHSQRVLTFVTAFGHTRQAVLAALRRLRRTDGVERAFELARNRSRQEVDGAATSEDVRTFQRLLSAVLYPSPGMRADPAVLAANRLGQPGLWGQGISGDHPILLARARDQEDLQLVVELVRAQSYWRRRGIKVDVVILNTRESGYSQDLQGRLRWLLSRTGGDDWLDARGGMFLVREDQLAPDDLTLLESVASVILDCAAGPLSHQLRALDERPGELPPQQPVLPVLESELPASAPDLAEELQFANGWGGFSADGAEYHVRLPGRRLPPAPWANVIANESLGFITTEAGLGATWSLNSGENRLTPWNNDPVCDSPAEAVYLRDEETAAVWSATPLPSSLGAPFLVRHGSGFTSWRHTSHEIEHELETFVVARDPVKVVGLRLTNLTDRTRRITATYYAELVLGVDQAATRLHVVPAYEAQACALLAYNRYNTEFGGRVAFVASNKTPHGVTTDRREFLGRLGSRALPAALARIGLSGSVVAGPDPCAALQLHVDLAPGATEELVFVLGQAEGRDEALALLDRYRDVSRLREHRLAANARWERLLGRVQVSTPDPVLNVLTNRWLNYQTLTARLWGRSGLYQASGAFGFRDQLQDVLALLYSAPELAREQIVAAASHQFLEGDVLHWWHPPSGRGVRTRISDDLLWLPLVTARYVQVTGDSGVLDEQAPFLTGAPLGTDEHERYDHYQAAGHGTVLEHCLRAIARGSTEGQDGLPLMGGGDWNDGMNRVGIKGRGRSVWLAWFLVITLRRFAELLRSSGRADEAQDLVARAARYEAAVEEAAWDGEWYLRAFYDDGSALGTHADLECRIDSIAQSWSVFALGDRPRTRQAMANVREHLVSEGEGLIRLFAPPFDRTTRDPGYIKGYVPGVRENGGQYTHGAIWTAWAFALLGEGETAHELYSLLAPVNHASTPQAVARYKVEPYVVAADVYGLEPHVGRGGWTWYTGSAAWLYRLALEGLLGLVKRGNRLHFRPRIPRSWGGFGITWREGSSTYRINVIVKQEGAASAMAQAAADAPGPHVRLSLDGEEQATGYLTLIDDGVDHDVTVELS